MKPVRCSFFLRGSRSFLLVMAGVLSFGLVSCGGGGGGSESTGMLNTPAVIDESNAVALTADAFVSQDVVPSVDTLASASAAGSGSVDIKDLSRIMQTFVARVEGYNPPAGGQSPDQSSATVTIDALVVDGTYGGTMTVSLTMDSATGEFSGTLAFTGFSEEPGVVESGTVSVTGEMDILTHEISYMSMTLHSFTSVCGSETYTLNGTMTISYTGDQFEITLDVTASEVGETIRFTDFTLSSTNDGEYITLAVNGRFGSSEKGYVDLSTPVDIVAGINDDHPTSGVLVATGATGSAGGPTRARLEFLSPTTFQVTADTDGDGAYDDYDSGVLTWEEAE